MGSCCRSVCAERSCSTLSFNAIVGLRSLWVGTWFFGVVEHVGARDPSWDMSGPCKEVPGRASRRSHPWDCSLLSCSSWSHTWAALPLCQWCRALLGGVASVLVERARSGRWGRRTRKLRLVTGACSTSDSGAVPGDELSAALRRCARSQAAPPASHRTSEGGRVELLGAVMATCCGHKINGADLDMYAQLHSHDEYLAKLTGGDHSRVLHLLGLCTRCVAWRTTAGASGNASLTLAQPGGGSGRTSSLLSVSSLSTCRNSSHQKYST